MMVNVIAHRGYWLEPCEQNSKVAFERALKHGFGIETDLRDHNQKVVISHDTPTAENMFFEQFLSLCGNYPEVTLALNIKADGLQSELLELSVSNRHFYFDMSVPDALGFTRHSLPFYTRYSELEQTPSLYAESQGVWLDNFANNKLDMAAMTQFLQDGKYVVLVSPELHKFCEKDYWREVKDFLKTHPQFREKLGICTDFPLKARDYFNG